MDDQYRDERQGGFFMFTIQINNTTIHLWPLFIVLIIAIICGVIRMFIQTRASRLLVKSCQTAQYEKAIKIGKRMLKSYEQIYSFQKTKQVRQAINTLNIYLSISYYGISQYELFLKHIRMVEDSIPEKHFWLALYYLVENDVDAFEKAYDVLGSQNISSNYLMYLNAVQLKKEGKCDEAGKIMHELYPKLNYAILKELI